LNLKTVKLENLEKSVKPPEVGEWFPREGAPFYDGGMQGGMR
jgi:hypothetical protein